MTTTLFLLLAFALFAAWWSGAQAALEAARRHGKAACSRAGVLWLDQAVVLERLRIRRDADGRLGVERQYRFEYSRDGETRHSGRLTLFGDRLVGFFGPETPVP